jgi:hypothetical protein
MSRFMRGLAIAALGALWVGAAWAADPDADEMAKKVQAYFDQRFADLGRVAEKRPSVETFREAMAPVAEGTAGFFGGTLIDTNFVIREVYFKRDFLARGFDLKKVRQLDGFWDLMRKEPAPQLSEPGHGNIVQPRLIAMRYPVLVDGKLENIVSMMVRTEKFLEATGLDQCRAFRITCLGKPAEEKGKLSESCKEVKLSLPSTEWTIQFDK